MVAGKPPGGREDGARPTERCQGATPSRPWLARGSDPSADETTVNGEEPCFKKKQEGRKLNFAKDGGFYSSVIRGSTNQLLRERRRYSVCPGTGQVSHIYYRVKMEEREILGKVVKMH